MSWKIVKSVDFDINLPSLETQEKIIKIFDRKHFKNK